MNQVRDRRDFAIVTPSFLDDYGLDPYEFRLYLHIVRRAGKQGCFESIPNMARHCLISEKIVRRSLRVLLALNLIAVVEEREGKTTIYEITPHDEWENSIEVPQIRESITPGKSATTTPGKSATTIIKEVNNKEIKIKEVPFKGEENPPNPQTQTINCEVQESGVRSQQLGVSALEQNGLPTSQNSKSSDQPKNSSLGQNSPVPLTKKETTVNRIRRTYQETGILPTIPLEIEELAQEDLGTEIIALYRKSGRITTTRQGDINPDFALYVTNDYNQRNRDKKDIPFGYSYILTLEWGEKRNWETLAALVYAWQAARQTGDRTLNIAEQVERQYKPKIDLRGIRL